MSSSAAKHYRLSLKLNKAMAKDAPVNPEWEENINPSTEISLIRLYQRHTFISYTLHEHMCCRIKISFRKRFSRKSDREQLHRTIHNNLSTLPSLRYFTFFFHFFPSYQIYISLKSRTGEKKVCHKRTNEEKKNRLRFISTAYGAYANKEMLSIQISTRKNR